MATETHISPSWSHRSDQLVLRDSRRVGRVLARVGDRWSVLVIVLLHRGPNRFNVIKRCVEGVSQQMLARTLRALERDGIVSRSILPTRPPQVQYALTELGQSISGPILTLGNWACQHIDEINEAQRRFDRNEEQAGRGIGDDA